MPPSPPQRVPRLPVPRALPWGPGQAPGKAPQATGTDRRQAVLALRPSCAAFASAGRGVTLEAGP